MEGAIFCPPLAYEVSIEMIKRCGQSTEYLAGGGKQINKEKLNTVMCMPGQQLAMSLSASPLAYQNTLVAKSSWIPYCERKRQQRCGATLFWVWRFFFRGLKKKKKSEMLSSINTEDHGRQTKGGCHSMIMMNYFRNIYDGVICSIKHYTGASH